MISMICRITIVFAVCSVAISALADGTDQELIKQLKEKFEATVFRPVALDNGTLGVKFSIENGGRTIEGQIIVLAKVEDLLGRRGYTFVTIAFEGKGDLIDRDIALAALKADPIFGGEGSVVKLRNMVAIMRYVPVDVTANRLLNLSLALVASNARLARHLAKVDSALEDKSE